jgi:hypothetical protein
MDLTDLLTRARTLKLQWGFSLICLARLGQENSPAPAHA